jgi:chromosome segregation ATPase
VATQTFFDLNAMVVELEQLEHHERKVSSVRRRLHDRLDSFPNELTASRERDVSAKRRKLHERIDSLRAELDFNGHP